MATLTLQQPNAKQLFTKYGVSTNIEATSSGWHQFDDATGLTYGVFRGSGVIYNTSGDFTLGTVTSVSSLDDTGATQWTVSDIGIAANATESISSVLKTGDAFSTYMVKDVLQGDDIIIGSSGNDYIWASEGSDTINGGAGNDWILFSKSFLSYSNSLSVNLATGLYSSKKTVNGVSSPSQSQISDIENIVGSSSNDTLTGDAKNNSFIGGNGSDVIDGGAGVDTVSYLARYGVSVNLTNEVAFENYDSTGSFYTDTLINIENLIGSNYSDKLTGNAANNMLTGAGGNDTLDGNSGFDTADFSTAYQSVTVNLITGTATGQGADTLLNFEAINGSSYGDTLTGNAVANTLNGNAGNDILNGGAGNDILIGGLAIDQANYDTATSGVTVNLATKIAQNTYGAGIDTLSGIENLLGSRFNDVLTGDGLANTLTGNAGNDNLIGGLAIDQANYDTATSGVTVNLAITIAQNTNGAGIDTLSGIENLLGSQFNDVLTGDGLANTLTGGLGNDKLLGGSGNDSLIGGAGKDSMTGDLGSDSFVFNVLDDTKLGTNKDVITDFVHGTDKINLAGIDADISVAGNQTFSLISSATAFTAAGQIKFNNGILSGDVAGDGTADFQIALTGVTALTASDFVL